MKTIFLLLKANIISYNLSKLCGIAVLFSTLGLKKLFHFMQRYFTIYFNFKT